MTRYLHSLSAILFYLLGAAFFLAYILAYNNIAVAPALQWMKSADLSLLCVALIYGGTSVYLSLTQDKESSPALGISLAVPLTVLFLAATILKFWPTPFILDI